MGLLRATECLKSFGRQYVTFHRKPLFLGIGTQEFSNDKEAYDTHGTFAWILCALPILWLFSTVPYHTIPSATL